MKDIVRQTLDFYFKKMQEPSIEEISFKDESLKSEKWCCFVTLYLNGEVRWSAGNVKEIHNNIASEIISSTMQALTGDKRFTPLTLNEAEKIQYRIDLITQRDIISVKDFKDIDPTKYGLIVIKRDYEKLAVILPNMSPKLLTWEDFTEVILAKLKEKKLDDKHYILYKISTKVETNY